MKIRNGFVSNSSSSSFVIMTTKEHHNKVVEQLTEYEKSVIDVLMSKESFFMGHEVISGGTYSDHNGCLVGYLTEDGIIPSSEDNDPYDAWYRYRELLREESDEVFTHSEDW